MKALSIRQPYAYLILEGIKRIENRTWDTKYRGPLAIHAGVRWHDRPVKEIAEHFRVAVPDELPTGGIVCIVDLVDVVEKSNDRSFEGPFGFVLVNPRPVRFAPLRGLLGLFEVQKRLRPL
jgi:hypothetical protein